MTAVDDARLLHALEAAYEQERFRRDQLEKKYARLKRRYIRLEQAHARMMALQTNSNAVTSSVDIGAHSSSASSTTGSLSNHSSPARGDLADVIDLTSPTSTARNAVQPSWSASPVPSSRGASMQNSEWTPTRRLVDDICAESPHSTSSEQDDSFLRTSSIPQQLTVNLDRGISGDRRPLIEGISRTSSTGSQASSSSHRPRPRLGLSYASDRRAREYEFHRSDADRHRASPPPSSPLTSAHARTERSRDHRHRYSTSTTSAPESTLLTSRSASRAPSPNQSDSDDAASLALAHYLQQQENIAAYEEYEARLRASHEAQQASRSRSQEERASAIALQSRSIDPDNMTYEELLQLGEQVGDVKKERWRQVAVQVLSSLPTHRWTGTGHSDLSCIVCQYKFVENDQALTLPCAHIFHEECVAGWIRENNSCPLCKLEIVAM